MWPASVKIYMLRKTNFRSNASNEEIDLCCPICYERLEGSAMPRCKHAICIPCYMKLCESSILSPLCPLCRGNLELIEIIFPGDIEIIVDCAFQGFTKFTELTIPETVMSIGDEAFS